MLAPGDTLGCVGNNMDVPDTLGDGVGRVEIYQGIFPASLMMIG